jgi:methyl-accepting chemotaxis protein
MRLGSPPALRIGTRLLLGFGVLALLAVFQGLWGLHYSGVLHARIEQVYSHELLAMKALGETREASGRIRIHALEHIETASRNEMAEHAKAIEKLAARIREFVSSYKSTRLSPVEQKLIDSYERTFAEHLARIQHDVLSASERGDKVRALSAYGAARGSSYARLTEILDDLVDYNANSARTRYEYAVTDHRSTTQVTVATILAIFAFSAVLALLVTRSITRPIRQAVAFSKRVATGDLTGELSGSGVGEIGELLEALRAMQVSLRGIVARVHESVDSITTATREMAEGHAALSRRTEDQVASLEETAANVEEVTSSARQNAGNSSRASELGTAAKANVERGSEAMANLVIGMGTIQKSADRISAVTGLIKEIAFQTNILSLNAAVEAGRAGEHGRGFAVVAGEVRELAHRCASAAKEIGELVTRSVGAVSTGEELVERARSAMQDITQDITQVTALMEEIAAASQEQTTGIEHISATMTRFDSIAQQNAALVEEASATAAALDEQATNLRRTAAAFKIDGKTAAARPSVVGGPGTGRSPFSVVVARRA